MKNKPLKIIALSIPCMWALMFLLVHFGAFEWLENFDLPELAQTAIIAVIANIPVFVFIGYGIYDIATTEPVIPKVKERKPWDKGNPLDVDKEWREKQRSDNAADPEMPDIHK